MSRHNMKNVGITFLIIVVFSAILAGQIVKGERPKDSAQSDIGLVNMDMLTKGHPLTEQINQFTKQIANYKVILNNENENLQKLKVDTEEYLGSFNSQLNKRLELIKDNSMKAIADKREELNNKLKRYHQQLNDDISNKLMAKKESLEKKLQDEISALNNSYQKELDKHKEALNQEYNDRIINLRLKLKFNSLSEAEHNKYSVELEELMAEKNDKLTEKENYYNERLKKVIEEKELEFAKKIKEYQNKLQEEAEKAYNKKEEEIRAELADYLSNMENNLEKDLKEREEVLREDMGENLVSAENRLISKVQNKINDLKDEINSLEERRRELMERRSKDIDEIIQEVAKSSKIKLVIADSLQNVDGIEITDKVLEEIKLGR